MDLFDYMREQNMEKEVSACVKTSSHDVGRSSGTGAYYRKGQAVISCD